MTRDREIGEAIWDRVVNNRGVSKEEMIRFFGLDETKGN